MGHRDDAVRCLKHLYNGQVEAEQAAAAARREFLAAADAATDDSRPAAERVRVATLARQLGVPRGTLLARIEAFRSAKGDRGGPT